MEPNDIICTCVFVQFEFNPMSEFKAERFKVTLQNQDTLERESVTVEVGLDGLKVLTPDHRRTLRVYALKNITRWELRDTSLILYAKTSVDVEERQVTLNGDHRTCQMLLDTLTSFYFQKSELRQSGGDLGGEAGSRPTVFKGRRSSKNDAPAVDDVEFWTQPEKEGWMYSQGEVIKTWRRRWFVLKSGFLFRFLNNDIDHTVKPRGVVDLSTVTDINEGSAVTGKQHSLKLSTATGYVCYLTDSETDMVEWLSALDSAHTEIVKRVAGVEEHEDKSHRGPRSRRDRTQDMVSVVGYDTFSATAPPAASSRSDLALNYGDIDGISGIVDTPARPANPMVSVNYGGGRMPTPSMYPTPVVPSPYTQPGYNGSIIDQTPHQTPSYPSFQSVSAPDYRMQMPMPHQSGWQVLSTPDGRLYYHNLSTGQTQWERPPELVM